MGKRKLTVEMEEDSIFRVRVGEDEYLDTFQLGDWSEDRMIDHGGMVPWSDEEAGSG